MTLDELIKKAQSSETLVEKPEEQEKVAEQLTPEQVADLLSKTANEVVEEPTEKEAAIKDIAKSFTKGNILKVIGGIGVGGGAAAAIAKLKMDKMKGALPEVTTSREMNIMQDYIERAYELGKQMAAKTGKGA